MSMYSQFPKQIRALDAIRRLKTYLETQGNTEKEPLPTMSKIVDYCILHPRLLRIRDSPLRALHAPDLPYIVVHDWYIGISLDYLEASLYILFQQWEVEYKKKRRDTRQTASLFSALVNDIYKCYEHTGLPLNMPFPEGSALASAELKEKVKHASITLVKEKISTTFINARDQFYTLALNQIESLFRENLHKSGTSFGYLFSPKLTKYKDQELEYQAQLILDSDLPGLVDVFNLSDEVLEAARTKGVSNDINNSISVGTWLINRDEQDMDGTDYDLEALDTHLQQFGTLCDQLNDLNLTPNWAGILKVTVEKRLNGSEWKDNWNASMVQIQLKWLHTLILPWLSYAMPKSEDADVDWNNFSRGKLKAEHVLYEIIYQSRIADIFDIIREYPVTKCAIQDFHIIATKRGLLEDLKQVLMQELQSRLLHQGASAVDILQQYIACTQCLSIIDPSCDIMVPIIELIENYMRSYRTDVVQGVVELIRDDEDEDLLAQAKEDHIYVFKQSELTNKESPRDTVIVEEDKPAKLRRLQEKSKDPIAMLISMCNTLKHFINGYSDKLGEILLKTKDYDTDAEVRRLELLKRNFPPDAFIRCDIMLRDVDDSRRLDKSIHENKVISPSLHAIILSRQYWPGGGDDDTDDEDEANASFQLWPGHQESIDEYDREYRRAKASRRLKFLPTMGSVTLDLEFETRNLRIDVRPEAALIIALFKTRDQLLTKEEITAQVGIAKAMVVECLEFWMKQNVLELSADGRYQLIEE